MSSANPNLPLRIAPSIDIEWAEKHLKNFAKYRAQAQAVKASFDEYKAKYTLSKSA